MRETWPDQAVSDFGRLLEEIVKTRLLHEAELRRAAAMLPETARSCPAAHNRALIDRRR